jgi:hypothetical protein
VCACAPGPPPQRRDATLRQLFASWQLVCHRSQLLRVALDRRTRQTKAQAFRAWRGAAADSTRRMALLHVSGRKGLSWAV